MTSAELASRLETATSSEARSLIKNAPAGSGEAFFWRVVELSASDPSAAERLSRHWKAVLANGDSLAYAYRAKAVGERLRGKWLESAESFQKAGRAAKNPIERLTFQRGAVDSLGRAGRVAEAVALGKRLIRGLDNRKETVEAARVRLNVGNALLWADEYETARTWLKQAWQSLHKAGEAREASAALLGLSTSEFYGGDPSASREYALQARDWFQNAGEPYFAHLCELNLAQEAILRGRGDEALDMLLAMQSLHSQTVKGLHGVDAARLEEFIGDAYFSLNLWQEAEQSYRSALKTPGLRTLPMNVANCHLGIGLALAAREDALAVRSLRRAASDYEKLKNWAWNGAARTELARSLAMQGKASLARSEVKSAIRTLTRAGSPYHLASARLVAAGLGDENSLALAEKDIRKYRFDALAWQVHSLRARAAPEGKRFPHYRRMFASIIQGRLRTTSTLSRAAYLRDKADALGAYLAELLTKPTDARIAEALDVVVQSRSAALIDEILSSAAPMSPETVRQIERLREELNRTGGSTTPGSRARFAPANPARLAALQRRWTEAMRCFQPALRRPVQPSEIACTVLAETNDGYYAIHQGRRVRLPISVVELREELKWLEFDLLGPMAIRDSCPKCVLSSLASLRKVLLEPWLEPGRSVVPLSPDGLLWRVPWQALLNLNGTDAEPLVLPSPLFGLDACCARLPKSPKAALWLYEAPDLPNIKTEAEAFLKRFPKAKIVRTRAEAMEPGRYDLVHVASHARNLPANPMFSAIQLEDGWLHAGEIAHCGVRAGLVTLSACETGRISLWSKTEPDGLTRAFLALGAQAVVASAWNLDDIMASEMMAVYYAGLTGGETVSRSLSAARQFAKKRRPHPYYWAPLLLFGGYHRVGGAE